MKTGTGNNSFFNACIPFESGVSVSSQWKKLKTAVTSGAVKFTFQKDCCSNVLYEDNKVFYSASKKTV